MRNFEELQEALMCFDEELMPHNYALFDFILDVILPNNPSQNVAVMCLLILCSFVPSGVPKTTLRHKNNYLHTVPMTKKGSAFLRLLTQAPRTFTDEIIGAVIFEHHVTPPSASLCVVTVSGSQINTW